MKKHFPEGYKSRLDFFETEEGIHMIKKHFQKALAERLSLRRVSAPRFIFTEGGLQDDLAGTQVPVGFQTVFSDKRVEFVHSLAKWKYNVPFVHRVQLFEMPILGYAGYLPFGLECAIIADMILDRGKKKRKNNPVTPIESEIN